MWKISIPLALQLWGRSEDKWISWIQLSVSYFAKSVIDVWPLQQWSHVAESGCCREIMKNYFYEESGCCREIIKRTSLLPLNWSQSLSLREHWPITENWRCVPLPKYSLNSSWYFTTSIVGWSFCWINLFIHLFPIRERYTEPERSKRCMNSEYFGAQLLITNKTIMTGRTGSLCRVFLVLL